MLVPHGDQCKTNHHHLHAAALELRTTSPRSGPHRLYTTPHGKGTILAKTTMVQHRKEKHDLSAVWQ